MTDYIYDEELEPLVLEEEPERAVAEHNRVVRAAISHAYPFMLDLKEPIVLDKWTVEHERTKGDEITAKKILYQENVEIPEGEYYLKPRELLAYRVTGKKQIVADGDFSAKYEETEWHAFAVMAELTSRRPNTEIFVTVRETGRAAEQKFGKLLTVPVALGGRVVQADKNYDLVMDALEHEKILFLQVNLGKDGKRYPRLFPLPNKK